MAKATIWRITDAQSRKLSLIHISNIHMLPKDGIQAMKDLHAKWTVPVHWGAFCICNHAWDDPIKQITTRSQKENLNVATPKIGEIVDYSHIETYQEHWWENVE